MLNPDLLNNKALLREQLRKPYAILENALIPEVAEALYEELTGFDGWVYQDQQSLSAEQIAYQETHAPGYTFSRHKLQFGVDKLPPILQRLREYLISEPVRVWMTEVSGRHCDDFEGGAAMLAEGGHIADHNDYGIFRRPEDGAMLTRSLTFNYYLTRNWRPEWGGHFIWNRPYKKLAPSFNTLVMFLVGQSSTHSVEDVNPAAGEPRLAVTGWYRTVRQPMKLGELQPTRGNVT